MKVSLVLHDAETIHDQNQQCLAQLEERKIKSVRVKSQVLQQIQELLCDLEPVVM